MRTILRLVVVLAATLPTLVAPAPASAQYFGRNKVQYKTFEFQVLKTEHFDIYFYPEARAGVDISARLAERWNARLSRIFSHQLRGRQPLVLFASHPDFEQTTVIGGELGEGTGGVTEPIRRRIVLPLGGPLADTDHVIGHELVHAFQFDIGSGPNESPGQGGLNNLPLWFVEGMAEYLSIGPVDPNTAMWLRDAAQREKLPLVENLDDPKYFPYRWGQAFWAYVAGRWGDQVVGEMLRVGTSTGHVDAAIQRVLGVETKSLSSDWHAAIRRVYAPVFASTAPMGEGARRVIRGTEFGGDLNVGPAISPDGRWIAFLSSRGFFSVDLYVAEAATGRIARKLTSTSTNPHIASLQFIYSAGTWDAASRRVAVAAVVAGSPALVIFDIESGRKERELPIPALDEIFNPTWAPDGQTIGFTGMSQGLTDLYTYDLTTARLRRLTNDAYADLQPAWSPDGRRIAFVTDRFSTDLDSLKTGPYRLAVIDVESGAVDPVPAFTEGSHIDPQWSPDGSLLYFVATPDGIPNLFRVTRSTGEVARITNLATGLSGITSSSPAMSVAANTGSLSVSLYEDGKYDIYVLDPAVHPVESGRLTNAAILPPTDRRPSDVAALLASETVGLPDAASYAAAPYAPKLSLEGVAQPFISFGASRFGAALGGGVSLLFSDMLGNHTLATTVQLGSGLSGSFSAKDTSAQAAYLNQAHRWNWGVVAGQVPYVSGGFQVGFATTPEGEPLELDQTILNRQTERNASSVVSYPLNRAQRVELTGGLTRISFEQIVRNTIFSLRTGDVLVDETQETSVAPAITLVTSAAALVGDSTNFGATSPVQGRRYRLEVGPTFGDVKFTSLLADYRRYYMPVPFYTLAVRALHYGRYGGGGEDPRFFPLYLGYPTLVRGYDVNTFDAGECVPDATSQCRIFDRLLGSRMLVGNVELRAPLLRFFGRSSRMYGPVPVELAVFADGGVAWNRRERPSFLGGTRDGVSSVGATFRVNLGGVAVGQFDFARPLQRQGRGWVFQFNLSPGF